MPIPGAGREEGEPGSGQLLEAMSDIDASLLQQSDFLLPLDDATRELYTQLLDAL